MPHDVLPKVCSGLGSADKKLFRLTSREWKKIVTENIHFLDIDARCTSAEDIEAQLRALPGVTNVHMALETQPTQASRILTPGIPPRLRSLQIFLHSSSDSIADAYSAALAAATALTSLDITWELPPKGEVDFGTFTSHVLQGYPCLAAPLTSLRHLGVCKGHPMAPDTLRALARLPHLCSLTHPAVGRDAAAAELTGLTGLTRLHVLVEHASVDMRPIGRLAALQELTLSVRVAPCVDPDTLLADVVSPLQNLRTFAADGMVSPAAFSKALRALPHLQRVAVKCWWVSAALVVGEVIDEGLLPDVREVQLVHPDDEEFTWRDRGSAAALRPPNPGPFSRYSGPLVSRRSHGDGFDERALEYIDTVLARKGTWDVFRLPTGWQFLRRAPG